MENRTEKYKSKDGKFKRNNHGKVVINLEDSIDGLSGKFKWKIRMENSNGTIII